MESEEVGGLKELSPAEALASARAGRDALARRVAVPWWWDAFSAASTGLFMWAVMNPPRPWLPLLLAPWPIASVWMRQARQNRSGVALDGLKRRVSSRMRWWFIGALLGVWVPAGVLDVGWGITRFVPMAAGICAAILFASFRWVNRLVVEAIRNAS